jgi:hypothetical protein
MPILVVLSLERLNLTRQVMLLLVIAKEFPSLAQTIVAEMAHALLKTVLAFAATQQLPIKQLVALFQSLHLLPTLQPFHRPNPTLLQLYGLLLPLLLPLLLLSHVIIMDLFVPVPVLALTTLAYVILVGQELSVTSTLFLNLPAPILWSTIALLV